jgi:hypothetical protein
VKLTGALHQLPDAGSELVEVLQHGRYRKPFAACLHGHMHRVIPGNISVELSPTVRFLAGNAVSSRKGKP